MMEKIREATVGDVLLRLFKGNDVYKGAVILAKAVKVVEGNDPDDVWRRMHDEVGKSNPKFVGFDGARNRFLHFFPNAFQSSGYAERERDYKVAAKSKLDSTVPVEEAATGAGFGEAILAVYRATNLLSPFEKTRMQDVLRGPNADPFIKAAARFTLGEGKPALIDMEHALKPHDNAKWAVVTYLPFLWQPGDHMYLKPEVTKDFTSRVGHRLSSDYEARLNIDVYDSLLDLVAKTASELTDLNPQDRIDVQSFIWVVGNYKMDSEMPVP
jgi:hypothetical protein